MPRMEFQGPGRGLGYEASGWRRPSVAPPNPSPSPRDSGAVLHYQLHLLEQMEKPESCFLPKRQGDVIATP